MPPPNRSAAIINTAAAPPISHPILFDEAAGTFNEGAAGGGVGVEVIVVSGKWVRVGSR